MNPAFILTLLAIVCLFLAAVQVPSPRVSLGWLGLLLWVLASLVR